MLCENREIVPVQIRIEEDVMFVSNCSMLPFGWIAKTLLGSHTSKPYNPDIARVFYRAGYIESWGRGIQKICDACKKLGAEEPEYIVKKRLERVCGKRYGYWKINEQLKQ